MICMYIYIYILFFLKKKGSSQFVCCSKEKSAKIYYFWKYSRMSTSLYFNHNFRLKVLDCGEISGIGKLIKK
jgi:hypothetical protein